MSAESCVVIPERDEDVVDEVPDMDETPEPENGNIDDEAIRRSPTDLASYAAFVRTQMEVVRWVFVEFTTQSSRRWMVAMVATTFGIHAIAMALTAAVSIAVNAAATHDFVSALHATVGYLAIALIQHVLWYANGVAVENSLCQNFARLDERVTDLFFEKTIGQHEAHGSRLNHATVDKGRWKTMELQNHLFFQAIPTVLITSLSLAGIFALAPTVGMLGIVVFGGYSAWSVYFNCETGKAMNPVETELRAINRERIERWEKYHRVMESGMSRRDSSALAERLVGTLGADRDFWVWFSRVAQYRMFVLQRCYQAFILGWCAWKVCGGNLSIGSAYALIYWSEQFASNLWMLAQEERNIGRSIVPIVLMKEALTICPDFSMDEGKEIRFSKATGVEFRNVSYAYDVAGDADRMVIRNVSFTILPGTVTGLIGWSGAGKSTIMKLLLRYADPCDGAILINGLPLDSLSLRQYLSGVGTIPQHAEIFDGTIGENLLYAASPERREELLADDARKLWDIMRRLEIDFGKRLTNGLDTVVGTHGVKLSGGQQQRVIIGAAVAKDPHLFVIDEATSSLDPSTVKKVQRGLKTALCGGKTALIVTHQLSTVRGLCDQFIVLRPIEDVRAGESQIEAIAHSFEDLHPISPTFRRLAADQDVHIS